MKEIVLKLYEFDELSKDSQERIIERERWNVMEQCMDAYDIDYNLIEMSVRCYWTRMVRMIKWNHLLFRWYLIKTIR